MVKKRIVAMLLAGGQGSRLGVLTNQTAKPAVPFGGKYRIIDFPLSNCVNSEIDTVGVLTQYQPLELNAYIGTGQAWDLDRSTGGVYVLPPYMKAQGSSWYSGTANAICQNLDFIDRYRPDNVLIISGDHIYKMNYAAMLKFHIERKADATIAVLRVPTEEASRFGIMDTDEYDHVTAFEEKPKSPKSNKASMGIYIFSWQVLRRYLLDDDKNEKSRHDFGKDIIPQMLKDGCSLAAYPFTGYWKDVGTIRSLWEANMDLIKENPALDLNDKEWRIYSRSPIMPAHYMGAKGNAQNSIVSEGCEVEGQVRHSVLFTGVTVGEGAEVVDSVVMPGAVIKDNARVYKAILGVNTVVSEGCLIGDKRIEADGEYDTTLTGDITLVASDVVIGMNVRVPAGKIISGRVRHEGAFDIYSDDEEGGEDE